ncbi:hypothetical protein Q4Q35_14250 [Flavivirga aquimarina]|uniref:Outer membrane protein beta-barrel domain-containing protein n=1 Tax=Flavivirga aquimarina TaxID=2027862 RepID=A0ABT8WCW8_9FLAO|nr:hypothetical protein [Flavivirga aquimarina]MDO5970965.1 hypothetical protein [Flavivirga aquimarina]
MIKKLILVTLYISLFLNQTYGQQTNLDQVKYTSTNKGKIFLYWGGNRGYFSKTDITFKGKDYNFTLNNMVAHDKPKGYHIDYINPFRMTIPQTNFRLGYFFTNHYNVSIGVDHMKYVVTKNQRANISGSINLPDTETGATFNGVYNDVPIFLTENFLEFEHTDGLNYINIEIARMDDLSKIFRIRNTDIIQINLTEGISGGLLYPKTNATLLGKKRHDDFHISGYGLSLKGGLNLTFLKYFFVQAELKGGYINMKDIRTTESIEDRASQNFLFLERIIAVGGIFRI